MIENSNMGDEWSKKCPDCGSKQTYCSKKALKNAKNRNSSCKSCANKGKKNPNSKEITKDEKDVVYFKYCPECEKVQTYSFKDALRRAKQDNTLCYSCATTGERNPAYKENLEYKKKCPGCEKVLEYAYSSGLSMSKKFGWHCSSCAANGKGKKDDLSRNCPSCGKELYYSNERTLKDAKNTSAECRECKSEDQPSPMKYLDFGFSEEHKKNRRNDVEKTEGGEYKRKNRKRKG